MKKLLTLAALLLLIIAAAAVFAAGCTAHAQNMKNVLTSQQECLSAIAALEAKGDLANLEVVLNEGYEAGLTTSQMKEALSQLYAYTGFPRSLNGLGTLQKVIKDRQDKGLPVTEGVEASPLSPDYDALKQGTEVQTKLTGVPFKYEFAPATDYYLKAHLFGDIFARDNLTPAQRELVTVSTISALPGCEPQLMSHVRGAKNMGLSDAEIHSIPVVLAEKVGLNEAYRCHKAIATVYGEPFDEVAMAKQYKVGIADSPYPIGTPNTGFAKYFIGNSYLAPLDAENGGPINVTFEPSCRNNWHIHHGEVQVLMCVAGRGWYQEEGKGPVEMTPGTVIAIPADTKHWHGAARDSWFQHLTYHTRSTEGSHTEWCEPVEGAYYNTLK